jgi:choline dehydrogenase-like flavoprotein
MQRASLSRLPVEHVEIEAEVCIIGAGAAGLVAATRLAGMSGRIVIVESGGCDNDNGADVLNRMYKDGGRYSRGTSGRSRGLGGTSQLWGGRIIPLSAHDAMERPHLGLAGWPLELSKLTAYTRDIERLLGLDDSSYEADLENNNSQSNLLTSGGEITRRLYKCLSLRNTNLAHALRRTLASQRNVEIWTDATACSFELDPTSECLRSVICRSIHCASKLRVTATAFILAAGTIETTRMLLSINRTASEAIFLPESGLGRYLQEHLKFDCARIIPTDHPKSIQLFSYRFYNRIRRNVHLELSADAQRRHRVSSGYAEFVLELPEQTSLGVVKSVKSGLQRSQVIGPALAALTLATDPKFLGHLLYWRYLRGRLFLPEDARLSLAITVEQLPSYQNRLFLARERDKLGVPLVGVEWMLSGQIKETLDVLIHSISRYWDCSGHRSVAQLGWQAEALGQNLCVSEIAQPRAHPSGTTRMGTGAANSVLDARLRCHRLKNVSIASASALPTAGSANPTLTIMQLACLSADCLAKDLRQAPAIASASAGHVSVI